MQETSKRQQWTQRYQQAERLWVLEEDEMGPEEEAIEPLEEPALE